MSKIDAPKVDYFLKLDGIAGESKDSDHLNEIDIYSWSFGAAQDASSTGSSGGRGLVNMHDITVSKATDKASSQLFLRCTNGGIIRSLVITCRKAGKDQQPYLVITCADVFVTSYQLGGAHGDDRPAESVSFDSRKMEISYREQRSDGTLAGPMKGAWDRAKSPSN